MAELKACGFLLFRREPQRSFLLMEHADRWDLPKGHVDGEESEYACAVRELAEETGIGEGDLEIDPTFRFTTRYDVFPKQRDFRRTSKELVIFLAWLKRKVEIQITEHVGFRWFPWAPPHAIQVQTIDPLLASVEQHWRNETP